MLYLSFEECRRVNIWFRVGIGLLVTLGVKSVIYNHQYSYLLSNYEQRRKQKGKSYSGQTDRAYKS